jgi:hypothetical protein
VALVAPAALHWIAAGFMTWEHVFPSVGDTSAPERSWRLALDAVAVLLGLA